MPSPETLESVKALTLLRTARNDRTVLITDAEQMWVEPERRYGGSSKPPLYR